MPRPILFLLPRLTGLTKYPHNPVGTEVSSPPPVDRPPGEATASPIHWLNSIIAPLCLFLLMCSFLAPTTTVSATHASTFGTTFQRNTLTDFPAVDPSYIYNQLFYMVTHFQHREAGYDTNLPPNINGHDEFAAYWSQEIVNDLQGFGPQVRRDPFPVAGWQGRPAVVPAFNVEVSIPGVLHPEQVIVIGCHYDGEAVSTQSANDDGSGCAIELGIARAMAQYWRSHHVYPARTLRFVIFDAEEQGLYGSFHYLNSTINGDVQNIVAMFNEEQNGIAYPLRFLGNLANPLLPFYIYMSPLKNNDFYSKQSKLPQQQLNQIAHFRTLMQQAISPVFQEFQALGFQTLTYHGNNSIDFPQPIFTPDQLNYVQQLDDNGVGSDQIPFTLAGFPCATFVGNFTYYDHNPPPWSYPYDQKQDTIQLMNIYANGSSQQAIALELSLALPGMLTTWMLNQPDVLGQANTDNNPITAISDIGQTRIGQSITLDAKASLDPNSSSSTLTYAWDFGDGTLVRGVTVDHTYSAIGNYTLHLTVTSSTGGKRVVSKSINVTKSPLSYPNPFSSYAGTGYPPPNKSVVLPTDNPASTVSATPTTPASIAAAGKPVSSGLSFILIVGAGLLIALLIVGIVLAVLSRRQRV